MYTQLFVMSIQFSKTFSTLEEQLHEEEVLYNEALRMHALSDVLETIKKQIENHKAELKDQRPAINKTPYQQCTLLNV
ncbi:MAG: hypothetical protein JWQ09_174 [Segetibacter sp.]|nr:hypothetical protein [Segetibacter sp.]